MKAVVMAGGEGTRLRPITSGIPKPLLPIANKPVMGHVLDLLKRHGLTDTVITVQFMAGLVRDYFGDGEDLGMSLAYATEDRPLGTAGSVKNAEEALRDGPFLVISGDALTDFDLSELVARHEQCGALVTVCLTRVANPLDFGITEIDADGRVQRLREKPSWGQVFSDTVNSGIYVMQPEVLDYVEPGVAVDWAADVFPSLLAKGLPVFGHVAEGYWEDIGTLESYVKAQRDVLERRAQVQVPGFEVSPGVWFGTGAEVHENVVLKGPLLIGDHVKVEAGVELREFTVLGDNVVIRSGAFAHRSVLHDNVFVGPRANLRGCVIGKNAELMRSCRLEEGVVVGEGCTVEEEAILSAGVKVYPFKTIEAGAVVHESVIWESRGHRTVFGPRGISGIVNVEITPELVVRLVSAFATTLPKGSVVTTSRDHSRAARALERAAIAALNASAIDVRDLEVAPPSVTRLETGRGTASGGVMFRTTPGLPESVDIAFLDSQGVDLSAAAQRQLERVLKRQEFRRAFPGEIGDLTFPARAVDSYVHDLTSAVDLGGVEEADLKVVVDCAGGVAALVLPTLLSRVGVEVLIVNGRLDDSTSTETRPIRRAGLRRLGSLVSSSGADFGVRYDPVGERIHVVDETGAVMGDERSLLVLLDLVAAECEAATIALPVTTTRVAEQVCRFHGARVTWVGTTPDDLVRAAIDADLTFGGDGRGGYLVPEVGAAIDGNAAFLRLLGLVARTRLTVSQIDARIPVAHVRRRDVDTPWAAKGTIMRAVLEAAGDRVVDTTDGLRVVEDDGRWVLVLPDPTEALTRVWAEAGDRTAADDLLDEWVALLQGVRR